MSGCRAPPEREEVATPAVQRRHSQIGIGLAVVACGMALGAAAGSAALWTSTPNPFLCPNPGSNACVAHTGFQPNKELTPGSRFAYWGAERNPIGNCTNYVAYRLIKNGASKPGGLGNADAWASSVRRALDADRVNGVPAVGAVAWWSGANRFFGFGGAGHVAYVEKVTPNGTVYLSDSRWASGSSRWTVRKGDTLWPEKFLHIKDEPEGRSPIGRLDQAEGLGGNRVVLRGWALDPDSAKQSVRVEAWIDGKRGQAGARRVSLGFATLAREDVAKRHPIAGDRHGFKVVITGVRPGTHPIRVFALNRFKGGSDTYLGGKTVRVPAPASTPGLPAFRETSYPWAIGDKYQSFMGDFNGDGQVDVGLRRISDGTFYWRLGPGFAQGSLAWSAGTGPEYQSFMGDFNGDNQVDVGLRRVTDGAFYWRLGPSFSQTRYAWAIGDKYQSFMGDFNGDKVVDVGLRRTTDGVFYWRVATP
jgi:surface antigen